LKRDTILTKIHLVISVSVVIPAAILYAVAPDLILELEPNTNDEHSFFKAVSGLYFGFAVLWILGLLKSSFLKIALVSNVVFMLGLGFGRLTSIMIDGLPSSVYLLGTLGELVLGYYGFWVLRTCFLKKP